MRLKDVNYSYSDYINLSSHIENETSKGSKGLVDVIVAAIFIILSTFGITTNALTFRVIWRTKSLRSTTNILLANIALSDFFTLVFGIPNAVALEVGHPGGPLGNYLCKFLTAGNGIGIMSSSSVLTLCLLAVERYNAIVKPMAANRRLTTDNIKYALTVVWCIAVVINVPLITRSSYSEETNFCAYGWSLKQEITYILCVVFILDVIPSAIIIVCYAAIIKEMYFSNLVSPGPTSQNEDFHSKRKILIILLVVTSVFLLCYGAFSVSWPLKTLGLLSVSVYNGSVQCLFVQSCINPIIYAFQSTNYRRALIDTLKCRTNTIGMQSNNISMPDTSPQQNL